MSPRREPASVVAALLLAFAAPGAAQHVKSTGDDLVSVYAEETPLGDLLRELAALGPVQQLLIDEEVEAASVTVELQSVPFSEAMIEVLQAASVNYVLRGGKGTAYQVYAGRGGGSGRGREVTLTPGESALDPIYDPPYEEEEEPEEQYEAYDDEVEDLFPEVSGDARLFMRPGSSHLVLVGTLIGVGLLAGAVTIGGRSSAARDTMQESRPSL